MEEQCSNLFVASDEKPGQTTEHTMEAAVGMLNKIDVNIVKLDVSIAYRTGKYDR